ncbi:triose-phosphate isomerase [Flavobacterium sp. W21_SRS_FM6]
MIVQNSTRKPIVAGNWKMNGNKPLIQLLEDSLATADLAHLEVVICPPFPYLGMFGGLNALGAQNMSQFDGGAHTGEIAASMLKECGCQYVILGHSERRAGHAETNDVVASKVKKALEADLTPILCVGETEEIRDSGNLFAFLAEQIDAVVQEIGVNEFSKLVLAYEPIWAIGTGKTASPAQAQEVHHFLREHLAKKNSDIAEKIRILYGGSVKGSNAKELFSQQDVDGGLIGGASLDPEDFLSICLAAKQ